MADVEKASGPLAGKKITIAENVTSVGTVSTEEKGNETLSNDDFLVTFAQPFDPENPQNWSFRRRWGVTAIVSVTGFNRILVSTIMAPAITTIARDLHMSSVESVMALSVYVLATAFGPLIIGPLSETHGRKPMIHATNLWFLLWNFVCGFANNKGLLLASRLLAGFGAGAVFSLGYGVLGDVWTPEQRGRSLALYLLIPLIGAATGPVTGGFIAEYTTWHWMFWSTSILQAILALLSFFIFQETYAPLILCRKAERLRKSTGDSRYHSELEVKQMNRSAFWKIQNGLTRPLRLLIFHPIVQIQAVLGAIDYGLLYFALTSFSSLWVDAYGESISISGLHYISICLGEMLAAQTAGLMMDFLYRKLQARMSRGGKTSAEVRVPAMIPGVIITPIGLFIYGWAAQYRVFWFVVDVGAFVLAVGLQIFATALQAYVMDSYPEHVSSASAASSFLRSSAAFAFPLFAPKMYEVLGYGWGNSLLAFASLGIGLPACFFLWRYGAKLRARNQSSF